MTASANFPAPTRPAITPHLVVSDANAAIDFCQRAFNAVERYRMHTPGGNSIMHAELTIGDSPIYLNDEFPEYGSVSPLALQGSPVTLHLTVDDADAWFERAVSAGATVTMPLENMFWGDRYGKLVDPFGHHWSISCPVEELSPEEINRRAEAAFR